ncbi:GtrA family protein [Thalassotalea aquiviva]|uniref:GtrA family protein n=1 Tax=Thalassotalea aquiviva TaxID=3242415 RepID=UPI00352A7F11
MTPKAKIFFLLKDDKLSKFFIVGLSNTLISYISFLFFFSLLGLPVFISQLFSYSIGIGWSYAWNNAWTFKSQKKIRLTLFLFIFCQILLMILSALLLHILNFYFQSYISLLWLTVMAFITVLNFTINKFWIFNK